MELVEQGVKFVEMIQSVKNAKIQTQHLKVMEDVFVIRAFMIIPRLYRVECVHLAL